MPNSHTHTLQSAIAAFAERPVTRVSSTLKLAILDFFPGRRFTLRPTPRPPQQPQTSSKPSPGTTAPTTKLSSTFLQRLTFAEGVRTSPASTASYNSKTPMRRTSTYAASGAPAEVTIHENPEVVQNAERKMNFPASGVADKDKVKTSRRRRSSSLMYQEPPESLEQQSDQAILPNLNSQWVNAKGEIMLRQECKEIMHG